MGESFIRFVKIHAFDRRSDGRTDGCTIAKTALHTVHRGKSMESIAALTRLSSTTSGGLINCVVREQKPARLHSLSIKRES